MYYVDTCNAPILTTAQAKGMGLVKWSKSPVFARLIVGQTALGYSYYTVVDLKAEVVRQNGSFLCSW